MSVGDVIVLALLALCVGLALRSLRKGKGSCSGDCARCGSACREKK